MIDVLHLRGTAEPVTPGGISTTFLNALDPARFHVTVVDYPADYGQHIDYNDSRAAGAKALVDSIRRTSNRVIISGYSQGAAIAGDLARAVAHGAFPGLEIVGCALIADPGRGRLQGGSGDGYGIVGDRSIPGDRIYSVAAAGDPICNLPAGNPLRSVADLTGYFNASSPASAMEWAQSILDVIRQRLLQRWWSIENWRDWSGALPYALGYLRDGCHTTAYLTDGHCLRLADAVNRGVT